MALGDIANEAVKVVAQTVVAACAAGLIWVVKQISAWFAARTKNTVLAGAIALGEHLAEVVVQSQQARLRPLLADPNVKLDSEQAMKIRDAAVAEFISVANNEGTAVARKLLSMGTDYFAGLIENSVAKMKRSNAVVAAVQAAPASVVVAAPALTETPSAPSPQ